MVPLPVASSLARRCFLASRCYPCQQCVSLPAGSSFARSCFPMALRSGAPVISTSSVPRLLLPIGPLVATCSSAPRLLLPINALAGNLHIGAPAGNLYIGAPASNKPHLAEKSTPVWLAIWHTWAGFANSQLLPDAAALSSMQGLPWSGNSSAQTSASLHPPAALRLRVLPFTRTWSSTVCAEEFPTPLEMSPWIASAQTDANLSAHLHRLPTPPPYLRRMRLPHGRGAGIRWVIRLQLGRG